MNSTLEYYEKNTEIFAAVTQNVDFTKIQELFLSKIPIGSSILDFGCGAGRDTKYFLDRGYHVEATDGCEKLCEIASEYTGIIVKRMLFQELDAVERYDGVWACSSILHLPKEELMAVMRRIHKALKQRGYVYTSFKYGMYEGYRNERYFTDFTEKTFKDFIVAIKGLTIDECWTSSDVRPGRSKEKWLNIILQKN